MKMAKSTSFGLGVWALTALMLSMVVGCSSNGLELTAEQELAVTALTGAEEDLADGSGDFASGPMRANGDVDRPLMFRVCDAGLDHEGVMERYDSDGDGELSDSEGDAVWDARQDRFEAHNKQRARMWHRLLCLYDSDADGELSDDERAVMHEDFSARCEVMHERLLEEFDADGDGELSESERETARETLRERREERREAYVAEHDENGDGELDADERGQCNRDAEGPTRDGDRPAAGEEGREGMGGPGARMGRGSRGGDGPPQCRLDDEMRDEIRAAIREGERPGFGGPMGERPSE